MTNNDSVNVKVPTTQCRERYSYANYYTRELLMNLCKLCLSSTTQGNSRSNSYWRC